MRTSALLLTLLWPALAARADAPILEAPTLDAPSVLLGGFEAELKVQGATPGQPWSLEVGGTERARGVAEAPAFSVAIAVPSGTHQAIFVQGSERASAELRAVPRSLALLPPIVAIVLALLLRQVLLALFAGVLVGAFVTQGYDPVAAFTRSIDTYAIGAAADADHASILIFSLLLGGMIGVITRAGGAAGLAATVTRRATSSMRGQLAAWALGLVVFFDDYANSLLVGSSMRPITDRLRVSREKLAFLVDATSAPVASLALVSSWIGVEVGYIGDELQSADISMDPYVAFLETLPYRFYPWLMLFFVLLLVVTRRDFGPMLSAERRARETGAVLRPGARPASDFADALPDVTPRIGVAAWPILTTMVVAVGGMVVTGRAAVLEDGGEPTLRAVFGSANSYHALLWASAVGGATAIVVALTSRALALGAALDAWTDGLKSMLLACVILVMAWSLGALCKELHTADVVVATVGRGLPAGLLGTVVFLVAAAVSFATGTSWGTMAILFPLVIPLAVELAPGDTPILLGAISSILAGAVFGDHCSPISDTTIMSSMASSCDHVDHVRTQLPYALLVGIVSLVVCELPTGLGLYPAWVALLLGASALVAVVWLVGRKVPDHEPR